MAKSSTDRQREYQERQRYATEGHQWRFQGWLDIQAYHALRRLAAHHSKPMKAIVEELALEADRRATVGMTDADADRYIDGGNV